MYDIVDLSQILFIIYNRTSFIKQWFIAKKLLIYLMCALNLDSARKMKLYVVQIKQSFVKNKKSAKYVFFKIKYLIKVHELYLSNMKIC